MGDYTKSSAQGQFCAYSAVILSILSLFLCFAFLPLLLSKIDSIRTELAIDSADFRVDSDHVWKELMDERADSSGSPSSSIKKRKRRQLQGICRE